GIPMTMSKLQEFAEGLLGHPVGENWAYRFVQCHSDIKVMMTTPLEAYHAKVLNRNNVKAYFDILEEVMREYKVHPENIYNMDEKGLVMGVAAHSAALVDQDQ
ncbi:hypothetical protein BDN71DRAFT_1345256, partial [Pleurotus eryngii]